MKKKEKKDKLFDKFKEFEIESNSNFKVGSFIYGGTKEGDPTSGCNTGDTYCGSDTLRILDDCDCDWDDLEPADPPCA